MVQLICNNPIDVVSQTRQLEMLETFVTIFEAKAHTGSNDFNDFVRATQLLKAIAEQQRRLLDSMTVVRQ